MPRKSRRQPTGQPTRSAATRTARKTYLIVCGGKSEACYFRALSRALRLGSATTVCLEAASPTGIVSRVEREESRRDEPFDRVWAVFDKDHFQDFDDIASNGRRRQQAQASSDAPSATPEPGRTHIGLAWSNPCFELWLSLHFVPWTKDCTAAELDQALKKQPGLAGYSHGDDVFNVIEPQRPEAVQRAADLAGRRERDGEAPHGYPSTSVHRLVEALEAEAAKLRPAS